MWAKAAEATRGRPGGPGDGTAHSWLSGPNAGSPAEAARRKAHQNQGDRLGPDTRAASLTTETASIARLSGDGSIPHLSHIRLNPGLSVEMRQRSDLGF